MKVFKCINRKTVKYNSILLNIEIEDTIRTAIASKYEPVGSFATSQVVFALSAVQKVIASASKQIVTRSTPVEFIIARTTV